MGLPDLVRGSLLPTRLVAPLRTLLERFMDKIELIPFHECWEWISNINSSGYGTIWDNSSQLAHRVAWRLFKGEIPDGMMVLHHCDNRACVNPGHLFVGDAVDNTWDMLSKGRYIQPANYGADFQRAKTHCPAGHPYSGYNLRRVSSGRQCRTCHNTKRREARAARMQQ